MSGLEERIANNLVRADIPSDARIVLACSGGVDSVVLARALSRIARSRSVVLAHANHGLRAAESDGDESFVRELAKACGMDFVSVRLPVVEYARESGRSIEEAGRTLRYEWLERVLVDQGATALLTAHHLDDLAETMIYRLARGTGLRGLRAMSLRQGNIVRPLLDVARSEIETYARRYDMVFREDATNADTSYARNLIRHEILPRMEGVHPEYRRALERFSRYAADCADFLDDSVREFLADADYFEISAFRARPDFLQREILRYLYESVHGSTVGLSEANIWEIMRFVYNGTNPAEKTLGTLRLRRVGDRVYHRNFPISKILSMSEKSVFTRIIEGEIPCYKIYEDEHVIAFLDINPIALGHTLVVPKIQIDRFDEVPEPYYSAVWAAVKKLSPVLSSALGTRRTGVMVVGFDVPHAHIHLVPANETADLIDMSRARRREDAEMREVLGKIADRLGGE